MTAFRLFLSSVQKEFAAERRAVKAFVAGDPLLRRFFSVFLFEDLPARDRRPDAAYLDEVDRSEVYVGLFGREYGFEDAAGVAPTEREFDRATAQGRPRLIFLGGADEGRHPKMQALIRKAGAQLIRKRFASVAELTPALNASLVDFLEERGAIQGLPFEDRPGAGASLADIDPEAVARFVRVARHERQFALREGTPVRDVLAHLTLLHGEVPTQAGLLLFGRAPQRFVAAGEVRCMHFHGTEVQRPAPSYQVFKGTLFEQVDRAADFVLSVLSRGVGTRARGAQAPVDYEIPPDVVREAVVNAVAHRDYTSGAAVQVAVFADRFEVWNHGTLLPPLTPERLSRPHASIARNPRICEALFLARYIEKFGTGTLMMIRESAAHALPAPEFEQREGEFVTTVWRDWLTGEVLQGLALNERQVRGVAAAKSAGTLTNSAYQELTGASRASAIRDLGDLVAKGIFERHGSARGAHYALRSNRLTNDSNDSLSRGASDSKTTQMTHEAAGRNQPTRHKPDKPDTLQRAVPATGNRAKNAPNAPSSSVQSQGAETRTTTSEASSRSRSRNGSKMAQMTHDRRALKRKAATKGTKGASKPARKQPARKTSISRQPKGSQRAQRAQTKSKARRR